MDWREGTWTMTQDQKITWGVDGDEIVLDLQPEDSFPHNIWLSERQAEQMICGLSYTLTQMRNARGRA